MDAPQTEIVVRRVRRRMLAAAVVASGGRGLLGGAVAGLVAVALTRFGLGLVDAETPWWLLLSGCLGLGLVLGVAAAVWNRPGAFAAAQAADGAAGLHDRLSNAVWFSSCEEITPSERLAVADAESVATRVRPRSVIPLRFGSAWAVWPPVVLAAAACGMFVPVRSGADAHDIAMHQHGDADREAVAEVIAQAAAEARASGAHDRDGDATAEALAEMEEIERELLDGAGDPAAALTEGARLLEGMADRAREEAEVESLADRALREGLADRLGEQQETALSRALAAGDLEAARAAADEIFDRLDALDTAERERLAEELDRLARQAESVPRDDAESPTDREGSAESLLREQGVEDTDGLADMQDREGLREALEREGVEPEVARELAEEIAERNRAREAADRAEEDLDRLAESAREAAEELRAPPPDAPSPEEQAGDPEASDREDEEPTREQDGRDESGEDGQGTPGAARREAADEEPGRDGGERGDPRDADPGQDSETEREGRESGTQQGERTDEQQRGAERADDQREGRAQEQGGTDESGNNTQRKQDSGESVRGRNETQGDAGDAGASDEQGDPAGERGGTRTDGEQPGDNAAERLTDGQGEAPDPRGVERFRRQLERMAEREGAAREQRKQAGRLREQAERMLEGASPEERQRLQDLAREMAREMRNAGEQDGSGAGLGPRSAQGAQAAPQRAWDVDDVEAGSDAAEEQGGRVIAEWFNDQERPEGVSRTGRPSGSVPPAMDEAARAAERAVERQAVPRDRRDLVRRVFERYRQRAAERASDGESGGSGGESSSGGG